MSIQHLAFLLLLGPIWSTWTYVYTSRSNPRSIWSGAASFLWSFMYDTPLLLQFCFKTQAIHPNGAATFSTPTPPAGLLPQILSMSPHSAWYARVILGHCIPTGLILEPINHNLEGTEMAHSNAGLTSRYDYQRETLNSMLHEATIPDLSTSDITDSNFNIPKSLPSSPFDLLGMLRWLGGQPTHGLTTAEVFTYKSLSSIWEWKDVLRSIFVLTQVSKGK